MDLRFGVDTLSYHCRLAAGKVELPTVLAEASELGFDFVQVNAVHLDEGGGNAVDRLRRVAAQAGLGLTLAGDVIGRAFKGESVARGAERIAEWLTLAERLGSPFVRVSSGFYRNELKLDLIEREKMYVIEALLMARDISVDSSVEILLENHSDFTPEEYLEILEATSGARVGVFLDLINPISVMCDPLPVVRTLAPYALAGHAKDYKINSHYVEDGFHRRGFEVQWCYPGEGVADLPALIGAVATAAGTAPYHLSVEGLDNRADVADQRRRLEVSLTCMRKCAADALGSGRS